MFRRCAGAPFANNRNSRPTFGTNFSLTRTSARATGGFPVMYYVPRVRCNTASAALPRQLSIDDVWNHFTLAVFPSGVVCLELLQSGQVWHGTPAT